MMNCLLLALDGFAGAFLQTNIGFGSALVFMNFLPLLMEASKAFMTCQITCICLSLTILFKYRWKVKGKVIVPLLIPALMLTVFSTYVAVGIEAGRMMVFLGLFLIALSIYFVAFASRIHFKPTVLLSTVMGSLSGVMNGLFSVGSPPAVLYLAPSIEDKDEYIATSQLYFLCINSLALAIRILTVGLVKTDTLPILSSVLGALFGVFVGYSSSRKLNATMVRRLVYVVIGINGLMLVVNNI